ncbi:MAG TPA: TlpA disulfide reductase family protein [Burkholderiales bacterium]|nr:TlpA disulfide reductase family protein [Burkholderiales bacterium]
MSGTLRPARKIFTALAGIALITGFIGNIAAPLPFASAQELSSDPVFASNFKDFGRKMQPLSQWKGKTLVVNFWATWCKTCLTEIPELIKIYDKYRSRDVVIVGVAVDNADKVEKFTKEHGISYPIVYGGAEVVNLSKQMGNKVGGLPFSIVIDAKGKVVSTFLGEIPKGKLEQILQQLVG